MNLPSRSRKGLLLVPEFPRDSFWSYRHVIHLIGRKATFPPLGLLTFAGYMPDHWDLELVDLNTRAVSDTSLRRRIAEADAVFVSAMSIQKRSIIDILQGAASGLDTPFVLGGPFASSYRDQMLHPRTDSDRVLHDGLDILVWGEAEGSMPALLEYLDSGARHEAATPRVLMPDVVSQAEPGSRKYLNDRSVFRPLDGVPLPRWDLIRVRDYHALMIQTTAGCPFRCDFCDIVQFNGGFNRPKTPAVVRRELEAILATGFRGPVFSVDDNFIGKPDAISVILDEMIEFQRDNGYPFSFITQASVDLGKDKNEHLIEKMRQAGFESVFLGIENPDEDALRRMNKKQNIKVDIPQTVKKIQTAGIEVLAGFIFGSDEDTPTTADRIVEFIQRNRIYTAMVGMLTPIPHTPLYERLKREGRLQLAEFTGNNTDDHVQFEPNKLSREQLQQGIRDILHRLFNPRASYERALGMIESVQPTLFFRRHLRFGYLRAVLASLWRQGLRRLDRDYFAFLSRAARIDRQAYRRFRAERRDLDELDLTTASDVEPSRNGSRSPFDELIDFASDYRIRFKAEEGLDQVRQWREGVRERLAGGCLTSGDIRDIHDGARRYCRARMSLHRFPGIELRHAMEAAVRGLHYEAVTASVLGTGIMPIALQQRPGAPMHS